MRIQAPLPLGEFTAMIAMMVSIVALATDIVLPALDQIAGDLAVADRNDVQMVVSALFLGFAAGQMAVGPLSDSFGRKPVIYGGYAIFFVGCLLSLFASGFAWMLVGRVLQGLGAAAPRVVTTALIRDGYEGRPMARIMSLIMAVFIIVPAVAPILGQAITAVAGWRACFATLLLLAATACAWFAVRQVETLPSDRRRPLSVRAIARGLSEIAGTRAVIVPTACTGLVFGAFLGYLSSAQQIFVDTYRTGALFPILFGVAALAIGLASFVSARLVMRLGMRHLINRAIWSLAAVSCVFTLIALILHGVPPLWVFMAWQLPAFFCVGILFGNLNALAMVPLGHMAGLGAAFVGSVSTFMSLPLGWGIGAAYDGTVLPLIGGFAVLALAGAAILAFGGRSAPGAR